MSTRQQDKYLEAAGWKRVLPKDRKLWRDPKRGDAVGTIIALSRQAGRDAMAKIEAEQKTENR